MNLDCQPNSPFLRWFGTHHQPTESQIEELRALLRRLDRDLSTIASLMVETGPYSLSLEAKQIKLKKEIDFHQGILGCIRPVPGNILQKIFTHCLPDDHVPSLSTSQAPLLLTHVCRSWRAQAHSIPSLWSSLHIEIPSGMTESAHKSVAQTKLACMTWWLHRFHSNSSPLSLSLSFAMPLHPRCGVGSLRAFPHTILNSSNRIQALELKVPLGMLLFVINFPVEFPLLEKITIRGMEGRLIPRGSIAKARIWHASLLRKVVWESVQDEFLDLPVDWFMMEEIGVSGNEGDQPFTSLSHREAYWLVRATPLLKRLRIQLGDDDKGRMPYGLGWEWRRHEKLGKNRRYIPNPILLPSLTALDLSDVFLDPDTSYNFLERLQLPALATLEYRLTKHSNNGLPVKGHPLLSFLQRSKQQRPIQIENWTVDAKSMSRETFFSCLQLMPALKRLRVKDIRRRPTKFGWDSYDVEGVAWLEQEEAQEHVAWGKDVELVEIAPDDSVLEALRPSIPAVGASKVRVAPNPRLELVRFDYALFTRRALRKFVQALSSKER